MKIAKTTNTINSLNIYRTSAKILLPTDKHYGFHKNVTKRNTILSKIIAVLRYIVNEIAASFSIFDFQLSVGRIAV